MKKNLKGVLKIKNERGSMLVMGYFVMVLLLGLGSAFVLLSTNEARVAERQKISTKAFYIAEAGAERAIFDLIQDLQTESPPNWADRTINGTTIDPSIDLSNFYAFYNDIDFNGGTYSVEFKNEDLVDGDDMWIKASGTFSGVTSTVLVYLQMQNLSPWGNAIFAGAGASGAMVNGNVNIMGSVHILGSGLADGDLAIDLGGTAELVGNNYSTCPAALKSKVPALPTVDVGGEMVETLGAELRVKKGIVGLSGSSSVGEANVSGNAYKEMVDGAYVTDGYGGNKGASNVHSDNGTTEVYDLGDSVAFPSITTDTHPDDPSTIFKDYFEAHSKVISGNLNTSSPFSYTDGTNSITLDGSGNLTINGKIYIDGTFSIGRDITYTGTGSLLVSGDVSINADLLTPNIDPINPVPTFPQNIMAIMTPGNMTLGVSSQLEIMGLFYAENSVIVNKQTDIMGTIVSNYFDMGGQVPSIFQVPETVNYLPDGLIGRNGYWYKIVSWQKI